MYLSGEPYLTGRPGACRGIDGKTTRRPQYACSSSVDVGGDSTPADLMHQLYEEPEHLNLLSRVMLAAGRRHASEECAGERAERIQQAIGRQKLNRKIL